MKPFKVIIAGGRSFNDYKLLCKKVDHILQNKTNILIVSGGANGADLWGENYAAERGYPKKVFLADWDRYGKSAGYKRNEQMAQYADACVCFWDGKSKGTYHMINLANKYDLKLLIVMYEPDPITPPPKRIGI